MSSSSDEDIPLSVLKATQNSVQSRNTSIKNEYVVKKEIIPEPVTKRKIVDDDSDDEMPLVSMKKMKVKKEVKDVDLPIKKKSVPVKREPKSNTSVKLEKRTIGGSSTRKTKKIAIKQQEVSEKLYGTLKGRLIQELLCRWWYAVDWPPKDTKLEETPELQPLDGFPGAFISVKGDNMGSIVDKRSVAGKPSFITFLAMPAKDIQELLIVAYENQMKVLESHEGSDSPLMGDLKQALKNAKSANAEKAEREAAKAVKTYSELAERLNEMKQ